MDTGPPTPRVMPTRRTTSSPPIEAVLATNTPDPSFARPSSICVSGRHTTVSPNYDLIELPDTFCLHGEQAGVQQDDIEIKFTDPLGHDLLRPVLSRLSLVFQYTAKHEFPNLDGAKQVEDEGCNVFAEGNFQDDNDTHCVKRSNLPAPSNKNLASDSTVSELQHSPVDHTEALQLGPAAASSYRLDLNKESQLCDIAELPLEMPIYGYFTLKTVGSNVVYCLIFSQELLPHPQH